MNQRIGIYQILRRPEVDSRSYRLTTPSRFIISLILVTDTGSISLLAISPWMELPVSPEILEYLGQRWKITSNQICQPVNALSNFTIHSVKYVKGGRSFPNTYYHPYPVAQLEWLNAYLSPIQWLSSSGSAPVAHRLLIT